MAKPQQGGAAARAPVAVTDRMPLASMSNLTSICGTPRAAGGMPSRRKLPSDLLSRTNSRSPARRARARASALSAARLATGVTQVPQEGVPHPSPHANRGCSEPRCQVTYGTRSLSWSTLTHLSHHLCPPGCFLQRIRHASHCPGVFPCSTGLTAQGFHPAAH